ncbi:dihydrofolate reductase family protein [Diaminobutyricibacter sp. McL0618]|uniref:dihydrofolate reductase family protein n=1 Tax=Leifsonia sp. McL0618 TaxID=3415677 RepID=UPI003CF8C4B2
MGKLIYSGLTSLDGYIADATGDIDWAAPDDEVHAFVNDLQRSLGTYLFGRRMYEVMSWWETLDLEGAPEVARDFAEVWRVADKVVYSSTLAEPVTERTRIERTFDPDTVRRMKDSADADLSVGGANLAASAIRAGLVDEFQQFLTPIIVGGGLRFLPDDVRVDLELLDEHRFTNGVVFVRYGLR